MSHQEMPHHDGEHGVELAIGKGQSVGITRLEPSVLGFEQFPGPMDQKRRRINAEVGPSGEIDPGGAIALAAADFKHAPRHSRVQPSPQERIDILLAHRVGAVLNGVNPLSGGFLAEC